MKESLYRRIARELAQQILSGQYPVGSLLPTEMALCEHYQVSRHTMREALRDLTEQGLITRRKGLGTQVADKAQHKGLNHPLACLEDLFFLAKNNPRVVKRIDEVVADYDLAQTIGCEPGSRWLHVASIREDSENKDAPICWTDSYASATFTKVRQLVRSDPFALISDLIETHYGIQSEEVRQTISAVTVSAKIAKVLGVEPGSPALKIVRRYLDRDGNTFETTISVHPADRYACSIVLTRAKG
ncbi:MULTISPECIES: GntR family transcriptional regulator [unclassified Symbiopectobacterium]|uniref:GntR family transcriptional regulator n=1 Tax=unclassified Symbiopectobacterium TaxID=2794573 RepID=UPI0029CAB2ED|nr:MULTISPECIES: GntR family transcriptional regulator [unclassified Symbiopectobacterium]MCW2473080.1 GntR family transcriptional regulator [Candidatus Symbiopectobacterium sp. NZEC151]MCW2482435.1 GntR family transcriptional regulator [Candidatus Symbiopectobacterium sp. NZEC135]MCW2488673.1 GntR family transcriptional regulator [Candidatus Symbiopectobacterium sp. NZEC127]